MQVARQSMFFIPLIIVTINFEQPLSYLTLTIYTGNKHLLYQKLSLHFRIVTITLQVSYFSEKPHVCTFHINLNFWFSVYLLAGSKALGTHTTGSHTMSGQIGGVTEASGATLRHNKPSNPLTGTSVLPMDSNRLKTINIIIIRKLPEYLVYL